MARARDCRPYKFVFNEYITGHHVHKDVWTPTIGDELCCEMEPNNPRDQHAVKVVKHTCRELFHDTCHILANRGKITVEVIGNRENSRGNGLEGPGTICC